MKYSSNKDIETVVKKLLSSGWEAIKKGHHWQIKSPKGRVLTVPSTPSDRRAILNFRSDIRRVQQ